MKRLVLLLTLTGILSVPFEGFAKSPKRTTAAIKYENGDKYVGEITKYPIKYIRLPILPIRFVAKNNKIRNGKGVMYYANGDSFDGSWNNDSPSYGTYQYANGDCFKGSLKNNYLFKGQLVFAHKGSVRFGFDDKLWKYPANSSFNGELGGRRPLSGSFDCALTSTTGDEFTGTIMSGNLDKGTILFANGDTFEGSFIQSAPSFGKYCYANTTKIAGTTYKWIVPAGCTFNGDVQAFTGAVDMEVTNETGDRFIGSFIKGQPDEGTMTFSNGTAETGKWHDGMSPSAYKAYLAKQEAERKRQEAEQKRQKAIRDSKDLKCFEDYFSKKDRIFNIRSESPQLNRGASIKLARIFIGKTLSFFSALGKNYFICDNVEYDEKDNRIKLTFIENQNQKEYIVLYLVDILKSTYDYDFLFPQELPRKYYITCRVEQDDSSLAFLCAIHVSQSVIDSIVAEEKRKAQDYYIRKYGSAYGMAVLNKKVKLGMTVNMVQEIYGGGEVTRYVESGREIIVLTYGGYNQLWEFFEKIRTYTFVNNRLTEYSE